jgi:hypothetical protein
LFKVTSQTLEYTEEYPSELLSIFYWWNRKFPITTAIFFIVDKYSWQWQNVISAKILDILKALVTSILHPSTKTNWKLEVRCFFNLVACSMTS